MISLDFEWLTDAFMLYCRSIQLLKTCPWFFLTVQNRNITLTFACYDA